MFRACLSRTSSHGSAAATDGDASPDEVDDDDEEEEEEDEEDKDEDVDEAVLGGDETAMVFCKCAI